MIFAGIDDGNSYINICLSTGEQISIASRAKAGEENQLAVIGAKRNIYKYKTSDGVYSVGNVKINDSTQFNDYPVSALNRSLVYHALAMTSLPDATEIAAASGLPLSWYYKNGKVNKDLVARKTSNLLMNDVISLSVNRVIPRINQHIVTSEAISSWLDIVLNRDPEGNLYLDNELASQSYGIIDLGGRTTDIAVVDGGNIDFDRSTTEDLGILNAKEKIAERVGLEFGHTPNEVQVETALQTGLIKLFGQDQNIQEIVKEELESNIRRVESVAKKTIKSSGDIDRIIFVGGSLNHFRPYVDNWYQNQWIADDPGFANARGMAKFIEFTNAKRSRGA